MEKLEQIYDETSALILELRVLEQSRWLARFKDAFEGGATAEDILLGIRFNLRQMLESGDIDVALLGRVISLLGKVEDILLAVE